MEMEISISIFRRQEVKATFFEIWNPKKSLFFPTKFTIRDTFTFCLKSWKWEKSILFREVTGNIKNIKRDEDIKNFRGGNRELSRSELVDGQIWRRKKTFSHLKYDLTIHIFSPGLYLYLLSFSHLKYDLTIHILLPTLSCKSLKKSKDRKRASYFFHHRLIIVGFLFKNILFGSEQCAVNGKLEKCPHF